MHVIIIFEKRGYEFEGDQGTVYERVCKAEREGWNFVMAVHFLKQKNYLTLAGMSVSHSRSEISNVHRCSFLNLCFAIYKKVFVLIT